MQDGNWTVRGRCLTLSNPCQPLVRRCKTCRLPGCAAVSRLLPPESDGPGVWWNNDGGEKRFSGYDPFDSSLGGAFGLAQPRSAGADSACGRSRGPGEDLRWRRGPHPLSKMRLDSAQRGSLAVQLPLCVEHLRHGWSLPGLSETVGNYYVPILPSVVAPFRLVPKAISRLDI
jgi:hypothetical protein